MKRITNRPHRTSSFSAVPSQFKGDESLALSAAFAAVEEEAENEEKHKPPEMFNIFDDEENVKDTLEFLGFHLRKKK